VDGQAIGGLGAGESIWHTDMSYNEVPPDASVLYGIEVPEGHGDTWFCDMERQRASGYGRRALVEADISRWKQVVGDGLRFQTDGRQATEVAIAAEVLNRMLDLGRPNYVRIA